MNRFSTTETSIIDLSGRAKSCTGAIDAFGLVICWESI